MCFSTLAITMHIPLTLNSRHSSSNSPLKKSLTFSAIVLFLISIQVKHTLKQVLLLKHNSIASFYFFQQERSQTVCKAPLIDLQQPCSKPVWDLILLWDLVSVKLQSYKVLLDEGLTPVNLRSFLFPSIFLRAFEKKTTHFNQLGIQWKLHS